jgi:hypothetical protein
MTDTFTTEKDIFDYLDLEYKEPQERVDGKAVVLRSAVPDKGSEEPPRKNG